MSNFQIILKQETLLFLYILIGWSFLKAGLFQKGDHRVLSVIFTMLTNPCTMFNSMQSDVVFSNKALIPRFLLLSVGLHAVMYLFSNLVIRKGSPSYREKRISLAYTNSGFYALPLLTALFGELGTLYASIAMVVCITLIWIFGITSLKEFTMKGKLKNIFGPSTCTCILAFILIYTGIRMPEAVMLPVRSIAAMNTPLALILTGILIGGYDLKGVLSREAAVCSAISLLAIPFLIYVLCRLLQLASTETISLLLVAACPAALLAPTMVSMTGGDLKITSGIFMLTTLFGLLTIPLFMLLPV